jgi:hypothetical protein
VKRNRGREGLEVGAGGEREGKPNNERVKHDA